MGGQQNVIIINGKRYDAHSGKLLGGTPHHAQPEAPRSMDGVTKRPATAAGKARSGGHQAHAVHGKTEKSKTLMRTAVKKPHTPKIHSSTHSVHASRHQHDPKTKVRAAQSVNVHKSSMISKFGGTSKSRPVLATSVLPVKEEPARIPHLKDLPAKRGGHASDNPFREAIENSSAHELPRHRKPRLHHRVTRKLHVKPRAAGLASLATAFLLIGGFFAYQNVPNLAVKMAATRAGVKAQLPAYRPAGFAMSGPVQYRPGHIAISFKSKTDDRNFVVSQSNSEWNSETLLENFVTSSRRPYQTYQDKGKTIYIYDGSNATWVDSGVWYKIEGNSSLNSDQLIRIANSL